MHSFRAVMYLVLCHIRGFLREPEAIFWTYGFPLLMVVGLGIAFSSSGTPSIKFDAVPMQGQDRILKAVGALPGFEMVVNTRETALLRLRTNKTLLVVAPSSDGTYEYYYDSTNPEARSARNAVDDALQRAAGRQDALHYTEVSVSAPGARYVDFLVPGLIGMNLMGGGLWGVGFVLVDMRIKKLMKRLLATPLRRPHFLLSVVGPRLIFFIPEAFFLLLAAHLIFNVPIAGSFPAIVAMAFLGTLSFAGLGLLAASRAQRIETISGIMNVIMLPMWLMSGIFFSSERFPQFMQPLIQALPLTQLINALRAIILEGNSLASQAVPAAILMLWAIVSFTLALKWFRWT
jgi:ABC-2 type transport system permease protein